MQPTSEQIQTVVENCLSSINKNTEKCLEAVKSLHKLTQYIDVKSLDNFQEIIKTLEFCENTNPDIEIRQKAQHTIRHLIK